MGRCTGVKCLVLRLGVPFHRDLRLRQSWLQSLCLSILKLSSDRERNPISSLVPGIELGQEGVSAVSPFDQSFAKGLDPAEYHFGNMVRGS